MKIKANLREQNLLSHLIYTGPVVREHSKCVADVLQLLCHNSIQVPG